MFIGHFAAGIAARPLAPRAPLPVLLAAPMLLDIAWPIFVLLGIERARIVPGLLDASPLDLAYMPYSHGLVAALGWSVVAALAYLAWARDRRGAVVVAALVLSHWVLDLVAHRADMPILHGDAPRYGLGLWRSLPATVAVEGAMFAASVAIYTRTTTARDRTGTTAWWALVATLAALYLAFTFGPPPPNITVLAVSALGGLALLPFAWWVERHRDVG